MDPSCDSVPSNDSGEKTKELFDKVFGQELLREHVLAYVIHDEKKRKAVSNIRSCRLVCKDWLRSVSRILLQCQKPLFRLNLTDCGCTEHTISEILCGFANNVSGPSRLYDRVPSFAIKASTDPLFKWNPNCFLNFLFQCARGLVELELELDNHITVALNANVLFPKLRKLKVISAGGRLEKHIPYIQSIVNACEELKSLSVQSHTFGNTMYPSLQAFLFPPSITELNLNSCLLDPEALVNNIVPNLKVLKLRDIEMALSDGLVTRILEKVKKTLKGFEISLKGQQELPMAFRLPLMEKLDGLLVCGKFLELEQAFSSLELLVPVMSRMSLVNQTLSAFRKWTDRSCFHSVRALDASVRSFAVGEDGSANGINFDLSAMESLKRAFPNLRELRIEVFDADTSVFKFIMEEMRNLQILRISHDSYDEGRRNNVPREFWDALLLGIPVESVADLGKSPEVWENLWENLQDDCTTSIRNMTALEVLELDVETDFKICDAVFHLAFFRMPKLTKLVLQDGFRVSKEMQQKWRGRGRIIEVESDWEESDSEESESESD